ncbi:MAG: hypothetical protein BECKG1743F_GA0114225_111592 [Candidatus Kentron sp. G]|nr:MAG: hypothetical protein BECKG1743F_GA0114225_111592 [Candidatus Kentron sp. G]
MKTIDHMILFVVLPRGVTIDWLDWVLTRKIFDSTRKNFLVSALSGLCLLPGLCVAMTVTSQASRNR